MEHNSESTATFDQIHAIAEYNSDDDRHFCADNYSPMIDLFGTVIASKSIGDYSGDTIVFYKKDGWYGYLVVGWGSCSGCDALQACSNTQDVWGLAQNLERDIRWFESPDEMVTYVLAPYDTDWHWHEDDVAKYIRDTARSIATKKT